MPNSLKPIALLPRLSVTNTTKKLSMNPLQQEVNQAWTLRWNQYIDLAFQKLAVIQVANNWSELNPSILSVTKHPTEFAECLLLKASLHRAHGELLKSSSLIAKTLREYSKISPVMTFKMHFELGLDHWCHEDILNALESFLQAEKIANTNSEKTLALSNALFSLEAIDLDRQHIESQLKTLLLKFHKDELPHVHQQYLAYNLRKQFFNGNFDFKFKRTKTMGQADFFLNYVSHLPYLQKQVNPKFQTLLDAEKYLWQGSYRLRTIHSVYIPADKNFIRVSDMIDRLYLWVWYWISGHSEISLSRIHLTLIAIFNLLDINNLSKENKLLLRNSMGWIQLFSPKLIIKFESLIKVLENIKGPSYPLLESEFLLIQKIKSLCYSSETSEVYIYPPFSTYFNDVQSGDFILLPRLAKILGPIIFSKTSKSDIRIIVDMLNHTITNKDKNRSVTSLLLARLFWFSYHKRQFQMKDIDSNFGSDNRQIYNLVSRAKKIDPSIKLYINNKSITSSMNINEYIFIGDLINVENSIEEINFKIQNNTRIENLISISATKLSFPKKLTRNDLARSFNLSKTTAVRVLNKWVINKVLSKEGQGKEVKYVWK